jgi:hypothetical protein
MVAQSLDAHPGSDQGAQHGSGGCADDDIEVLGIDAVDLLDGLQGTHGPGSAEHATTTEDQAPAWRMGLRINHGQWPPSLRHRQSAWTTCSLEEFG